MLPRAPTPDALCNDKMLGVIYKRAPARLAVTMKKKMEKIEEERRPQ